MRAVLSASAAFVCSAASLIATDASATVLTFDNIPNGTTVPQTYGDRVGGMPQSPQFSYGAAGGPTPNVVVEYRPTLKVSNDPIREYGDLNRVLYRFADNTDNQIEIVLTADEGYLVCLYSFDMAAVFNTITQTGEDLPVKFIKVIEGNSGTVLYSKTYPQDLNETIIPGTLPLRHNTYNFEPNLLKGQTLRIVIDLNQITNKVERFGLDNIQFGQFVPSPGAAAILAGGVLVLAARRKRA